MCLSPQSSGRISFYSWLLPQSSCLPSGIATSHFLPQLISHHLFIDRCLFIYWQMFIYLCNLLMFSYSTQEILSTVLDSRYPKSRGNLFRLCLAQPFTLVCTYGNCTCGSSQKLFYAEKLIPGFQASPEWASSQSSKANSIVMVLEL